MFKLDDILDTGLKIIDKVIPDPEAKAKAKQDLIELKQNGELKLEEFDLKRDEVAAKDRSDARKMQINTKSFMPGILSVFVTTGFFGALYIMLTDGIPEGGQRDAMLIMLGALGAAFTQVVNFWLGSSNGSKQKTDLMDRK